MKDAYFYLHRPLLSICLGRDLCDLCLILSIGIGVGRDPSYIRGLNLRKVALVDIQFYFEVVEIGQRYYVTFCALIANKPIRDEFAGLYIPVQYGSSNRRSNHRVLKLFLCIVVGALRLNNLRTSSIDLLLSRT